MISEEDLSLYKITSSHEEAVAEVLNFYKNYHSMRYVKNQLVLRFKRNLTSEQMAHLNADFTDILTEGEFEQSAALAAEQNEDHLADFPRLVFRFNRRNLGRLRQLIDTINATSDPPQEQD